MQNDTINNAVILEKSGAAQIIAYLYLNKEKAPINLSELIENVNATSRTIRSTLDYLTAKEITEEQKEKRFPFERNVKLTPRGLAFAQYFVQALTALQHLNGQDTHS